MRRKDIAFIPGKVEEVSSKRYNEYYTKDDEYIDRLFDGEEEFSDDDDNPKQQFNKNDSSTSMLNKGRPPLSEKELNHISKMIGKKRSFCPPFEILLLFPIIFIAAFSLTLIPGFVPLEIFDNITAIEQPVCAPLDKAVPGLPRFVIPTVIVLVTFLIVKTGGDLLVATFSSLILLFDPTFTGMMGQSPSASLMAFFILMGYCISHNILFKDKVYGFSWFLNLIIAWCFAIWAPFFRPESLGMMVGLYMCFFISCLSDFASVLGNKVRIFLKSLKMIFISYLIGIPLLLFVNYLRRHLGAVAFQKRSFMFALYQNEFKAHEALYTSIYIIICLFVTFRRVKFDYKSIVVVIQLFVAAVATVFIPYESPGNTIAMRMFFLKLCLMLNSGILLSRIENSFVKYSLPVIFLIISAVYKLVSIALYIKANPDLVKSLFNGS